MITLDKNVLEELEFTADLEEDEGAPELKLLLRAYQGAHKEIDALRLALNLAFDILKTPNAKASFEDLQLIAKALKEGADQ